MFQSLVQIGCGILIGIGLIFLIMALISKNCGDSFGAGFARMIAFLSFLLAIAVLGVT